MKKIEYINRGNIIFWTVCIFLSVLISIIGYNITTYQWWISIIASFVGYSVVYIIRLNKVE